MKNVKEFQKFIQKRPTVKAAYGYGSGVFQQSGYQKNDHPQIDFIFVVEDLKKWHFENMKRNPKDYSWFGKLFFRYASISKLKGRTGITYLSNILENGNLYKYGTIEEKDFMRYLETWESFYVPGRFQKTILPLVENQKIKAYNQKNREQVLKVALLTLPVEKEKKLVDVYTQICGLSYFGDTRMRFAENPKKVSNIVAGSFEKYHDIYGEKNSYFHLDQKGEIVIDYPLLMQNLSSLPSSLRKELEEENVTQDLEQVQQKILFYFTKLNKKESMQQTIKGIFTNGPVRSIQYAFQKIKKKWKYK